MALPCSFFWLIKKKNNFQFSDSVNLYTYVEKKEIQINRFERHQRETYMFKIPIMLEHCRFNAVGLQTGFDV